MYNAFSSGTLSGTGRKFCSPKGTLNSLRLSTAESSRQARIPEDTTHPVTIQTLMHMTAIGPITRCSKPFTTESAFPAGDAEGVHFPLTRTVLSGCWAHGLDDANEFVAKEVTFLELGDGGVQAADVGAADCGAGYADDYVAGSTIDGFGTSTRDGVSFGMLGGERG